MRQVGIFQRGQFAGIGLEHIGSLHDTGPGQLGILVNEQDVVTKPDEFPGNGSTHFARPRDSHPHEALPAEPSA